MKSVISIPDDLDMGGMIRKEAEESASLEEELQGTYRCLVRRDGLKPCHCWCRERKETCG